MNKYQKRHAKNYQRNTSMYETANEYKISEQALETENEIDDRHLINDLNILPVDDGDEIKTDKILEG